MHAISQWYRTVYIPWLVTSYDMHKGKRRLNSNPPNHRGGFLFSQTTSTVLQTLQSKAGVLNSAGIPALIATIMADVGALSVLLCFGSCVMIGDNSAKEILRYTRF